MTPPTDHELMLFADGELEATPRHDEIAAWLDGSDGAEARAKLATLDMVGGLLSAHADEVLLPDGFTDRVMAAAAEIGGDTASQVSDKPVADRPVGPLKSVAPGPRPSNDNSRGIFVFVAAAVAAAAGVMLWASGGEEGGPDVGDRSVPVASAPNKLPEPAPTGAQPLPDNLVVDNAGGEVEVAAVDFGSTQGSIFYVAADEDHGGTAVVWLSDDADESSDKDAAGEDQ